MKGLIIDINSNFDRERFDRFRSKEFEDKKKKQCSHDETTFDGEIDEVVCDNCTQKWSSFEYLWHWVEKGTNPRLKVFQIENAIHFLTEEKRKLDDEIFYLKKERRALKVEITKIKKTP